MLFFNFLCLFYLMVLINSHTISKNTAYEDTVDGIVDSIHDFEYRREYKPRHDRLHRYYRKEEKEDAAEAKKKDEPAKSTAARLVSDTTVTKLIKTQRPVTTTTKRSGFWHKFRNRGNGKKSKLVQKDNEVFKRKAMPRRRSYRDKQNMQSYYNNYDLEKSSFKNSNRVRSDKRNRDTKVDKRKRDVSIVTSTATSISPRASSILDSFNSKTTSLFNTIKTYQPLNYSDNLTKALTALTTHIDDLKKEYGLRLKSNPSLSTQSMIKNISSIASSPVTSTQTTTDDVDFLGTAQIEALLNDIKVKAVKMVAEQSPAVTDIITNTVTETSFEADPILTHISTPGYALSTFISIDVDNTFSKRTADTVTSLKVNDTVLITNTEPTHHIGTRSINEDVHTIAQTIEDMLQKELKKVFKKVKGKMSSQLNHEVNNAKTTIKKEADKISCKMGQNNKKQSATSVTTPMTTPKIKTKNSPKKHKGSTAKQVRRTPKHGKNGKNKEKTTTTQTQTTFDDYVMLTLFEQILSKTHEDNVMKMLTMQNVASKNHEHFRLLKRTPERLARVSLQENVQKLYDDATIPDDLLDYDSKSKYDSTTDSGAEDTSYEGLSNKISYNDYVNGYKHYLKFQKEQGNQNFSNLVRYQAHRHHSVDDIGKFILNKIPQLPSKRRRRFFDDDIMDDQDISTKSDDSWFKKHFYLFIDNGPPRKFHTSQTVELKSPITDFDTASSTENTVITPRPKSKGLAENAESNQENKNSQDNSIEDSLDQMSKALDERKNKEFDNVMPGQGHKLANDDKIEEVPTYSLKNNVFKSLGSINLVDKLFGAKGRRTPKHNLKENKQDSEEFSEVDRKKRNSKAKLEDNDNFYTSHIKTLRSTAPNVVETRNKNIGYVDVNLIPRPTAIVKLRENKQKKSKFKNFFNKFRFRKRNKHKEKNKSVRAKRAYRAHRFNPLKKLKDMFKVKEVDKPAKNIEMQDYEMMTSHIDTFKPVKYDKVMSVDEIKGQIPNITEDIYQFRHGEALKPAEKLDLNPITPAEEYESSTTVNTKSPSVSELAGSQKITPKKHPKLKPGMKQLTTFKSLQESSASIDIDMPEDTYDPSTNKFETSQGATPSLDDIKSEIDSLQRKLSMSDEKKHVSTASSTNISPVRALDNFSARRIYVPPHIQGVQIQPKVKAKVDPKDIKIQTKLTRIAKFPLSRFTHEHNVKITPVIERPQIYEGANEDQSQERFYVDVKPAKRIRKKSLNTYVTVSPRYQSSPNFNSFLKVDGYKPYPDYFNDLLMWHGDLLNTDRLTSPQWENILRNLKDNTEASTLSMTDMQRELLQMKDYIKIDESLNSKKSTPKNKLKAKLPMKVKKDKTRSNNKKSQNIIKTVALKDNTIAEGDDIIIQGEAKYFHLMKQPEINYDKYMKAADLLNNLNKIYFKSPAIKYNIEDKIHDAKRNGEFWLGNADTKSKNSKDLDNSSVLFLDTTLLAYDDGPDFLTDRPKHKKMSKNSPPSSKLQHKQGSVSQVAKTNASPVQYFSTPLPMRMNEFERFLKENQLDVQSVTTPLVGMPQFVLAKPPAKVANKKEFHAKTDETTQNVKNNQKTSAAFVTINPFNLYNNNFKLTSMKSTFDQSTDLDDKREKRYSELRNERFFTFEPFRKKTKAGKVKKKIKLFDKKANTPATTLNDLHYTFITQQSDNDIQKEVELTIINMNDIDHAYDDKMFGTEEKKRTDKTTRVTTRAMTIPDKVATKTTIETTTYLIHKLHNNRFTNHKHKYKIKDKTKVIENPYTTFSFDSNFITDDFSTTTFHPLINHELFSNLHAKHPPKRVRISSHSYKYDIIYNDPKRRSKSVNHGYKYANYKHAPLYKNEEYKPVHNSDFTQNIRKSDRENEIVKIVKAVEAVEKFTRPNVMICIDLPTYYKPEIGHTESIEITTTPKTIWNDFVMKYLSGIALIELLNKFGILKVFDGNTNFTDGVGKAVNANKVFSNAEYNGMDNDMKQKTKLRRSRQVTDRLLSSTITTYKPETILPNWREKRRLKLFTNIKGKLKTLLRKYSKPTSTITPKKKALNNTEKATTKALEDHKEKREKKDEIKEGIDSIDDGFNVDYDFDIDKIVERATMQGETTNKLVVKDKNKNELTTDSSILKEADIPYLSPMISEEIPVLKENITSTDTNNEDLNKQTTPITKSDKDKSLTSIPPTSNSKINQNQIKKSKEEIYFEPSIYEDKIYYESTSITPKSSSSKQKIKDNTDTNKLQTKSIETKLEKRDIQPVGKFTAKDVAALEVIVDLVKNTVNYEERDVLPEFTETYYQNHPSILPTTTPLPKSTQAMNSIQVHIAIPYNLQGEQKRSLDSFKVRRVFAAKMFSPVDLEYQVQSFEDTKPTTAVTEPDDYMTPRMYLLIDANGSLAKGNFPLKPLPGNIDLSKVRVRQATITKAFTTQKAETTSGKSIGRVTLSKDFVAAVNKHLVQLYENLTALQESTPKHRVKVRDTRNKDHKKPIYRRHINWEAVKKYFGHDRVCNCKCKPNRTMCRACAASDAVIDELIFEFKNLAKYMNDHCTEIQTFFWMNPSGGKKLRDTVHKVDQSLHDYFKRVKGKCQGRTCKTFSTCIDKRSFVKHKKIPKNYIGNPLIADLQRLADDIETAAKLGIRYTDNLVIGGETLLNSIGNCIKDVSKREKSNATTSTSSTSSSTKMSTKKQMVKNIYSLDNINVNIICKPDSKEAIASSTTEISSTVSEPHFVTTGLNFMASPSLYDYETDEIPYKKKKSFRNFFAKRNWLGKYKVNNPFKYYVTQEPDATMSMKVFRKRQAANQIDSPLVSDTGGTFWQDYLRGKSLSHETTTTKGTTTKLFDKGSKEVAYSWENDIRKISTKPTKPSMIANQLILTTTVNPYPEKHVFQRNVNTTDYSSVDTLSHNINELFKIFHNLTDLKEIEDMSTQTFEPTENRPTTIIKPKHTKKTTKIMKIIKSKLHFKHKCNSTKNHTNIPKTSTKMTPPFDSKGDSDMEIIFDTPTSKTTTSDVPNISSKTTEKYANTKIKTKSSELANSKSTTIKEESSVASTPLTKQDVNVKSTDEPTINTKTHVKNNFLNKIKMATLDFLHDKAKVLHKSTTKLDSTEEIRKSRSPATENSKNINNEKNKFDKSSLNRTEDNNNVVSEGTTDTNPTILIINEYDTEMDTDTGTNTPENEHFEDLHSEDTNASRTDKELNENFRSLLISILNYEAKKLDTEWKRIKKEDSYVKDTSAQNSKRGIFSLYISTESAVKKTQNVEIDYDLLETLKDLELPTPKGLDTEKKGSGLLQKIANKFGVRVVPTSQNEKPKATSTEPPALHSTSGTAQLTNLTTTSARAPPTNTTIHKEKERGQKKNEKLTSKQNHSKLETKYTTTAPPTVTISLYSNDDQETSKPSPGEVCNINATLKQVQDMLEKLPRKDVQKFISNMTCKKYKKLPKYLLIDVSKRKRKNFVKKYNESQSAVKKLKWDWIRNRRSINYRKNEDHKKVAEKSFKEMNTLRDKIEDDSKHKEIAKMSNFNANNIENVRIKRFVIDGDDFETLEKDKYGIYRNRKKRSNRANDIAELVSGLKNLPYLSRPNESYAMLGDTVTIQCATNRKSAREDSNEFKWLTDRKDMLLHDNVVVDGKKLMIRDVEAKNEGEYICQKGTTAQRKVRLTIITLPTFEVVFTPTYSVDQTCTYDDLKAVTSLGPLMTKEMCSNDQMCSVRIEEPVCLRDRLSNAAYLQLTAVMSVYPEEDVRCSGRCRRDLHNNIALMAAANAPALASVGVIIMYDDANKTLVPSYFTDSRRAIITHTLRRKDSMKRQDHYSCISSPNSVNIITSCPAGYYLVPEQKICAACPVGSRSNAGDNSCEVGSPAKTDRHSGRFRRCFWWYPGCGWCAAGWGAACACAGVVALVHARGARGVDESTRGDMNTARKHTPRARPLSPSRVILAKFFKSHSSTKATDSQEAKFGIWKEKNMPPPLPPIDFDI